MDEPVAELAAYFRTGTKLPDEELAGLTLAARAVGNRWEGIAAACGITTYKDLGGVIYRITAKPGRSCCSPPPSTRSSSSPAASTATRR